MWTRWLHKSLQGTNRIICGRNKNRRTRPMITHGMLDSALLLPRRQFSSLPVDGTSRKRQCPFHLGTCAHCRKNPSSCNSSSNRIYSHNFPSSITEKSKRTPTITAKGRRQLIYIIRSRFPIVTFRATRTNTTQNITTHETNDGGSKPRAPQSLASPNSGLERRGRLELRRSPSYHTDTKTETCTPTRTSRRT